MPMTGVHPSGPSATAGSPGPLADPLAEAGRVAQEIRARGLDLRFAGGIGVALTCPSARRAPLAREYADLDLAGRSKDHRLIVGLFEELGYREDREFNALNSSRRLLLHDDVNERCVDVFLDEAELCHKIDLRHRVAGPGAALPAADLLLLKLQVYETTQKDLTDILAILVDHPMEVDGDRGVDLAYLAGLAARDWGLWRTTTMVARRVETYAASLDGFEHAALVAERVDAYLGALDAAPKSRSWRLRARVGDKVRWYELPEEKA